MLPQEILVLDQTQFVESGTVFAQT